MAADMHAMFSLWQAQQPLVLASGSASRAKILREARLPFETLSPEVDERALEEAVASGADRPSRIAAALAREKALEVSRRLPGRLVLGGDQLLALDDDIIHKASDLTAAHATLRRLSGHTHHLHCAACFVDDGKVAFETLSTARMTMHALSDDFITRYLETVGEDVLGSVGCYHIEGAGVHLFDRIAGDHWTIRGLPLLPLLAFLRESGYLCR